MFFYLCTCAVIQLADVACDKDGPRGNHTEIKQPSKDRDHHQDTHNNTEDNTTNNQYDKCDDVGNPADLAMVASIAEKLNASPMLPVRANRTTPIIAKSPMIIARTKTISRPTSMVPIAAIAAVSIPAHCTGESDHHKNDIDNDNRDASR